jgi:hypothetical protein
MHRVATHTRLLGQLAPKPLQCFEDFIHARLTPNTHSTIVFDEVDLITFLQAEFKHKFGGQTDS